MLERTNSYNNLLILLLLFNYIAIFLIGYGTSFKDLYLSKSLIFVLIYLLNISIIIFELWRLNYTFFIFTNYGCRIVSFEYKYNLNPTRKIKLLVSFTIFNFLLSISLL